MSVLVIGGNGFIGSHVVDALLASGHDVLVYDRFGERFRAPLPGVTYISGDLGDLDKLSDALDQVSGVIHLVSTTVPGTAQKAPVDDINGNLIATVRLLQMMVEKDVGKIVYLSSGGTVYGIPQTDLVAEDHPLAPIGSYGIVKVAIENYLRMFHHVHGLNYTVLRPSNPFGPRQGSTGIQGIIGNYLWNIRRGEPLQIWGDGSVCRDYVRVQDVARQCVLAIQYDAVGVFNSGSGRGHTVVEISEAVQRVTGVTSEVQFTPGRAFDIPRIVLDCTAAKEALGWQAELDLDAAILETWEWIKSLPAV